MLRPSCATLAFLHLAFQAAAIRVVKKASRLTAVTPEGELEAISVKCNAGNLGTTPKNVPYGFDDSRQVYDLYPTRKAFKEDGVTPHQSPVPLVVFVHGGSWKMGSKEYVPNELLQLREARMHVAAINYRLSPEATHPTHVEDVKAAMEHFRSEDFLTKWHIDPNRVILSGLSAGGQLASWVGLTLQPPVTAVINIYGVVVMNVTQGEDSAIAGYLGCTESGVKGTACNRKAIAASPPYRVTSDSPPFLHIYGVNDLSYEAGLLFYEKGVVAGADYTWVPVECRSPMDCHSENTVFHEKTETVYDTASGEEGYANAFPCNADLVSSWIQEKLQWFANATECASVCKSRR